MSDPQLPADFEWVKAPTVLRHKTSGRTVEIWKYGSPNAAEIAYCLTKKRREYRRDRLFQAVGRDMDAYRAAQVELRDRGYLF